jgi:hypothetical protein
LIPRRIDGTSARRPDGGRGRADQGPKDTAVARSNAATSAVRRRDRAGGDRVARGRAEGPRDRRSPTSSCRLPDRVGGVRPDRRGRSRPGGS